MNEFGIRVKLIKLVMTAMEVSQCQIEIQSDLLEPLQITNGVRQGNSLSCLLFNIALEKVVRDAGIQTRGTIYTSNLFNRYANDIDIMGKSENDVKQAFTFSIIPFS